MSTETIRLIWDREKKGEGGRGRGGERRGEGVMEGGEGDYTPIATPSPPQ